MLVSELLATFSSYSKTPTPGVDSPIPSGPLPAAELGSGGLGEDGPPLGGPSSKPLFKPPMHQGNCYRIRIFPRVIPNRLVSDSEGYPWMPCVVTDDPVSL